MQFLKKIKQHSLKDFISYLWHHILNVKIGKEHYLRLDINIDFVNKQLEGFSLPVKELVYEDFLKGDKNIFKEAKLEYIMNRLEDDSYKCYGIIENDRLIYSTWVSLHKLGLSVDTKPIWLASDEGLLEDSFCDPIARGRGIHGKMNFFRIKKLYELGKKRVVAIVLEGNTPAMKVQLKSGFKELGIFYNGYCLWFKVNTLNKRKYDRL